MFVRKRYYDEKPNRKEKEEKPKGNKALIIILGIILVIYFGFSIYFTTHFYFNTYINEVAVAGKTVKDLKNDVSVMAESYVLTINGREGITDTLTSADISLTPEFDGEFEKIRKEQNALLWPVGIFHKSEYEVDTVVSYSKEQLNQLIDHMTFFQAENCRKPENAHISEATKGGYSVIPEDKGTVLIKNKAYDIIAEAVDVLAGEVNLDEYDCYENATILSDDPKLQSLCNNLNQYAKADIIYQFGEDQIEVDAEKITEWLTIDGTNVTMDEELVREFVNSVARKYDTFGRDREFTTTSGNQIEVHGGAYGWWMDRAEETAQLIEAIKKGESGIRTPVYRATAAQYGEKDFGDSYVEIDLTKQHLWVYKDGEMVVETDFVSGNVNKGNGTPTGTYGITYKERDATLKGENYSSDVSYWMPFNGNVGMHDAPWRSSFGGEIYLTNGSHGCINLPVKKAAEIYDYVEKGEAVIVYGGATPKPQASPDELTPEQQLQLLIEAGLLNPDGTIPETTN